MTYREAVRWVRALPREKAPAGFARRVMEAVESHERARRIVPGPFRMILAAAAALALCAGAALWLSAPAPKPAEPPSVVHLREHQDRKATDKDGGNAAGAPIAWNALSGEEDSERQILQEKSPDAIARLDMEAVPPSPAAPLPPFAAPAPGGLVSDSLIIEEARSPARPAQRVRKNAPAETDPTEEFVAKSAPPHDPGSRRSLEAGATAGNPAVLSLHGDPKGASQGASGGASPSDGIPIWTIRAPRNLAGRPARTTAALASIAKARGGVVDRALGAYLVEIPADALPDFRRALVARGFVFASQEDLPDAAPEKKPAKAGDAAAPNAPGASPSGPSRIRLRIAR